MILRAVAVVAAIGAYAVPAWAEPYFAVREGVRCSGCHVNITGGGMRTDFVDAHARDILRYPNFFPALAKPAEFFNGDINQYLGLGFDLRVSDTAIFQDTPVDGRVDNNEVFRGRLEENDISVNEADLYVETRLIPDVLSLYLDQQFSPSVNTREAWAMLRLPWDSFAKAGKMFLPYGLQMQDDTAFIRGGRNGSATTGFSFLQEQAGLELGTEPDPFSVIASVTDGPPGDRTPQVTGTAYALFTDIPVIRNFLLGGSFSWVEPSDAETTVFGFFTGTNLGPFTYLGEIDFLSRRDDSTGGTTRGVFIHYSELNWLLFGWMNAKFAFDYADDDGDLSNRVDDSENRFSVGLEPFLSRFLQLRLFYRISNGVESQPSHNQNLIYFEIHVFF